MNDTTKEDVLAVCGEKWVVDFINADGTKNMGLCNHHQALPKLIQQIRSQGGKNIKITDQTIFFYDGDENE